MTVYTPFSVTRRSSRLFQWEASDLSLTARTGQVGTFGRADAQALSVGVLDSNGRFGLALPNQARFASYLANDGVRYVAHLNEPAVANLVLQASTQATSPWAGSVASATNAAGTFAGTSFSRINNANGGVWEQPVTYTGNGTKAFQLTVRSNGAAGTFGFGIFDNGVPQAWRGQIVGTINADGTISGVSAAVGTLLFVKAIGDGAYQIGGLATGVVAGNANRFYVADGTGRTATSYFVACAQTVNAAYVSSPIVTTATSLTRVADSLTWPCGFLPQALTMYVKYIELSPIIADTHRLFRISNSGTSLANLLRNAGQVEFEAGGVDSDAGAVAALTDPVYGDVVEVLGSWQADSTTAPGKAVLTVSVSVNGGAITTATVSTGSRFPTTFTDPTIEINHLTAEDSQRPHAFLSARIALGVLTLAQMRATA